jgi:dTDP-4-amino-4,6-dideoxygalactose transaminase
VDAAAAIGAQKICEGITFVFSLHATKALSSGEGGLIVTQNLNLAARLRAMTNFGIGLQVPALGTNAKLSEYHAAVGLAHAAVWSEQAAGRMALLQRFQDALLPESASSLRFQRSTGLVAPSVMCVQVADPGLRERLEAACARGGILTRRWYLPLLQEQPMILSLEQLLPTPNAEWLSQTLLGLPFFLGMTDQEFHRVVAVVLDETLRVPAKDLTRPFEVATNIH